MTAFDSIAADYDRLWTSAPRGKSQRLQVWNESDALFGAGDTVLDLGCGTGDDALHLESRGVRVCGIDASAKMVEIASARGVDAQQLGVEHLYHIEGPFSGALSNFGALNCVSDLRPVAAQLGRLVRAGGAVAICIMGRFAWAETFEALCRLDLRQAGRRWAGRTNWRGIEVFYHTSRGVRSAFAKDFAFTRRVSIGRGDHQLYLFKRRAPC